jgi:hypothetical protein
MLASPKKRKKKLRMTCHVHWHIMMRASDCAVTAAVRSKFKVIVMEIACGAQSYEELWKSRSKGGENDDKPVTLAILVFQQQSRDLIRVDYSTWPCTQTNYTKKTLYIYYILSRKYHKGKKPTRVVLSWWKEETSR